MSLARSSTERCFFRFAAQNRFGDKSRQIAAVGQQLVGAVLLEADFRRDRIREQREAAGDEAGIGAILAHGVDQFAAARRQRDALAQDFVDHSDRQTFEQRHALAQRRLERDLAAHGTLGDGRDMRLEPGEVGELVDAFLADHGGIHVGEEQFLAPAVCGLNHHVDRPAAERRTQPLCHIPEIGAVEGDVCGDAGRKPFGGSRLRQ